MIAALLALPALSHSAPGPTVRQLMDEPASLFDVAMVRLHRLAYQVSTTLIGKGDVNAYYDADENRFVVGYSDMNLDVTESRMHTICENALSQMAVFVSKGVPGIFQHAGEDVPREESEELREALLPLFDLYCVFYGRSTTEVRYKATMSMADREIVIQEE